MRQFVILLAWTVLAADSSSAQTRQVSQLSQVRLNRTIELLAADKPVFGVFGWNQSVDNAIALARSDLDFVIIDLEHRPYDVDRLRTFLLAMTDKGASWRKDLCR